MSSLLAFRLPHTDRAPIHASALQDLPHALAGQAEHVADLLERFAFAVQAADHGLALKISLWDGHAAYLGHNLTSESSG